MSSPLATAVSLDAALHLVLSDSPRVRIANGELHPHSCSLIPPPLASPFISSVQYSRYCHAHVTGPVRCCGRRHAPIDHLLLSTHCCYAQL
ncbi:hypothetical protein BD779DRAFT_1575038 [Infundibulicybe gibba]|nr:hypothetical protein BD779DRAFT_1575038 [Infundibulicybe gibba]